MTRIILILILINCWKINIFSQEEAWKQVQIDTLFMNKKNHSLSQELPISSSIQFFSLNQAPLTISDYKLDLNTQQISINHATNDTIIIKYHYYNLKIPDTISINYAQKNVKTEEIYIGFVDPIFNQDNSLTPSNLDYSGSIGRGLSVGNNQSLVLNSNLNLNLQGDIGNNIQLNAVLSDANIPIQAEGNTQQLQEFDQVYIQLTKDNQLLHVGDLRIESRDSYFSRYAKKLKGVKYEQSKIKLPKGELSTRSSVSFSGGKFHRQIIQNIEGNQGPYKLRGSENEAFIIIQSGTEKVYIDGQPLIRGEQNDYIISYDRAEVIFTEKRPITKDSRIIIEFEYQAQNYARSIISQDIQTTIGKMNWSFNAYREHDNKNASGILDLTNSERSILTDAGANREQYRIRSIYPIEKTIPNEVYYTYAYSTELQDSILTYSSDPSTEDFRVTFSDVGENQGSYIIAQSININARVYEYVGKGKGRYEPVKVLIPAKSKSLYSLSNEWNYHKKGRIQSQIALSNHDQNLFSKKDNDENLGLAFRLDFEQTFSSSRLHKDLFNIRLFSERTSKTFRALNQYRPQEFMRDWNISDDSTTGDWWSGVSLESQFSKQHKFGYQINHLTVQNQYKGTKQIATLKSQYKRLSVYSKIDFLNSQDVELHSRFTRPFIDLSYQLIPSKELKLGIKYNGEKNLKYHPNQILNNGSFQFNEYQIYLNQTNNQESISYGLFYTDRIDLLPLNNDLEEYTHAKNIQANLKFNHSKHSLDLNASYRILQVNDAFKKDLRNANYFLGGLNYQFSLFDGKLKGNNHVGINAGQEPKLEFDYREVQKGEGTHVWIDDGDGIKEKNEFQLAPFTDQGDHIKISLYNNEFIQVVKQEFEQTLRWNPIAWKLSKNKLLKTLGKLSSVHNIKWLRKDQIFDQPKYFSFANIAQDTTVIGYNNLMNHQFYWNRGNPSYSIIAGVLQNKHLFVLTNGKELKSLETYHIQFRKNILRKWNLSVEGRREKQDYENFNFNKNNYSILTELIKSSISYTFKQKFNIETLYSFAQKNNLMGEENSISHDFTIMGSLTQKNQARMDISLQYKKIRYNSSNNEAINFVILEGLQEGNNFLWQVSGTKRIYKNFDLIISYNGRKSDKNLPIHSGSLQLRANF